MAKKLCRVSFKGIDGIGYGSGGAADTMYEAAGLGLKALKRSDWIEVIGPAIRIVIQVQEPPVEQFMMFGQLTRWLDGGATNPADLVKKKRLKEMLASSRPRFGRR